MAGKMGVQIVVLKNRLPAMPAAIRQAVASEIERGARGIEAGAKQNAPVRTGTLRRSINTQIAGGGLSAIVAAGVDYALYVERGTRRMGARPFMVPAFEREVPKIKAGVTKALRGLH